MGNAYNKKLKNLKQRIEAYDSMPHGAKQGMKRPGSMSGRKPLSGGSGIKSGRR